MTRLTRGASTRRARLLDAVAVSLEPLESRLLLSSAKHSLTHPPFCGPLAVWSHDLQEPAKSHKDHEHHEHPKDHHKKDKDKDKDKDNDKDKDDDGEGDGGDGEEGEEEEEDREPAPALATDPDGTGSIIDVDPIGLSGGSWNFIGPGPANVGSGVNWTGRIAALAAHPTDANTIYVAAAGGGVWKTTNGGTSWTVLTDNQATLFMGAIAIAPTDPNTIYAGTGEANNSIDSFYGRGVLKSTDGGATWTLMGNSVFDRRSISRIIVDPTNASIVYATVGGFPPNGFSGNRGVWKSLDGGATWTNTTAPFISTSANFSDLLIDPTNRMVLYAAVGQYNGNAANGVYKSIDGGATWAVAGNFNVAAGGSPGRIALALAPSSPNILYGAVTSTNSGGYALQRIVYSIDGGASWNPTAIQPSNYMGGQGWYDTTLIVDPSDPNLVYAGGAATSNHVLKGTNATQSNVAWTGIASGSAVPHVDHHAIGFDANGKLLDGNDGGIWRLNNPSSISWQNINGNLGTLQFQGIAIHPTNPNIAFGGTQDNGTLQYQGSTTWQQREGGDGGDVAISKADPNTMYHIAPVASFGSGSFFRRSTNGGLSWQSKATGLNGGTESSNFYPPFVMDPANSSRLLLGTNRVYETTNNADSWTPISTTNTNGWNVSTVVDAIAPAPSDVNTIYASANGGAVFVTTDHDATWSRRDIPTGDTNNDFSDLLVDPADSQTAFAVRDRFGANKVFRTVNGGVNWLSITGNLPDYPVNTIELDPNGPGSSDDVLYVGNDIGAYATTNVGQSWTRVGDNFPNAIVFDLEFAPALNLLAAGTHGRGVWETSGIDVAGTGSIAGNVFTDLNTNGVLDAGEPGIAGAVVYLDLNNSNTFDGADAAAVSSAGGNYVFNGLADGTYQIGLVTPANNIRIGSTFQSATVVGGGPVTDKNFGNFPVVFTGSNNGDNYVVATDPGDSARLQILETLFGDPTTTYSIAKASVPPLTFNAGSGDDVLTLATTTTLQFNGGAGHDTLNLNAATYTFNADALAGSANLTLNVNAAGVAVFNATQHLESLSITDGQASMPASGNRVLVTRSLAITGSGKLDLADNDLVVDYSGNSPLGTWDGSAYTGVTGLLQSGSIDTSSATSITELAVAEASEALDISDPQTALFAGQTVDATAVLVKYTYSGDATLDGKLNVDDYGRIDMNVAMSGLVFGFVNGDFNYDGKINVDDYGLIDFALPLQGVVL